MNERFREHVTRIPDLFRELDQQPKVPMVPRTLPEGPAIYVFWEDGAPKHVGRARKLRQRVRSHQSKGHSAAAFAFKLTRQATGRIKATYTTAGSRADLMADEAFATAFAEQSTRVKAMLISHLRVEDPIDQYLLELYAALEYGTSLTEFDTH